MIKSLKNLSILFSVSNLKFLLNFLTTIILVRLLFPEDFGYYISLLAFIEISFLFMAISSTAIFKYQFEENTYFTSFIIILINILFIIFIDLTLFNFFFNDIVLNNAYLVFLLILFSKSLRHLTDIFEVWLEKNFKLSPIFKNIVYSALVSNTVAIYLAYQNFGILSLAFKEVVDTLIYSIIIFYYKVPFNNSNFDKRLCKIMIIFSFKNFFSRASEILYLRLPVFFLSSFYSYSLSGLYERATYLANINRNISSSVFDRLFSVSFAKYQKHKYLSEYLLKINLYLKSVILLPVFILVLFYSYEIIILLFGNKWEQSGIFLSYLSFWIFFSDINKTIAVFLMYVKSNIYLLIININYLFGIILGIIFCYYLDNINLIPLFESIISIINFLYLIYVLNMYSYKLSILKFLSKPIFFITIQFLIIKLNLFNNWIYEYLLFIIFYSLSLAYFEIYYNKRLIKFFKKDFFS